MSHAEQQLWNGKNQEENGTRLSFNGTVVGCNGTVARWNGTIAGCNGSQIKVIISVLNDYRKIGCCTLLCYPIEMCLAARDIRQRQRVSKATAILTEREWPLHPFPLQLPLAAVAAAVN